jgi:PAS domain S-box-containing protein
MHHLKFSTTGEQHRLEGAISSFLLRLPQAFRGIAIYDSDGHKRVIAERNTQSWPVSAHDQPWFMGAVSELALTGTAAPIHVSVNSGRPYELIYALALQNPDNAIYGVAVLVADMEMLSSDILLPGRYIRNHDGEVVMGKPDNSGMSTQLIAQSNIRLPGQPELRWQFISETSEREVLVGVRKTQVLLAATFVPTLIIAGLLMIWIVYNLAKPLTELAAWVRRAGANEMEASLPQLSGPIEIREIAQSLVDLRTRVTLRQQELHNQAEHLRVVAEFAADWELWVDANGICRHCSPSVEEITGVSAKEILGQNHRWWLLVDERDRDELKTRLLNLHDDHAEVFQWRMCHVSGETRWIEHVVRRVTSREGQDLGWRATLRDITKRRELEQHLRHAHRVEEISRLSGGIAHDFNNLLSIIGGHAELLNSIHNLPGLSHIISAVTRGANLTRQLLVLSRRRLEQQSEVNVVEAISQVVDFLRPTIGPEILMTSHCACDRPVLCRCSPHDFEQVLVNLINNARDALAGDGEINIHLSIDKETEAVIEVFDTGPGLSESVAEHIFEPYFTTKSEGKGTGLGLAMAQAIIEGNQGDIKACNREDRQGSVFTIRLPLVHPSKGIDNHSDNQSDNQSDNSLQITTDLHGMHAIVVDDNAEICTIIKTNLTRKGAVVRAFIDPREAVRQCAYYDNIDVIISDIRMPYLSGPQMVTKIREKCGIIPVIFITGDAGDHSNRLAGMDQWQMVLKPASTSELIDAVGALRSWQPTI